MMNYNDVLSSKVLEDLFSHCFFFSFFFFSNKKLKLGSMQNSEKIKGKIVGRFYLGQCKYEELFLFLFFFLIEDNWKWISITSAGNIWIRISAWWTSSPFPLNGPAKTWVQAKHSGSPSGANPSFSPFLETIGK